MAPASRRGAPGEGSAPRRRASGSERPPSRSGARTAARPQRSRPPRQPPRERKRSDLGGRVLVAVPAAVVAIALIDVGGLAWMVFMMVMGCLCLQELYTMIGRWKPVPIVGFASAVGMCAAAHYGTLQDVIEVFLATIPVVFLAVIVRGQERDATVSIAGTMLGVAWIGLAFAHAVLLRDLVHGKGIMIDVAVATFLGDTGAYLGGRMFGHRPLAPAISPKKTVEGLFCGVLVAIVSVYVASIYQNGWSKPALTGGVVLGLGLAIAAFGPLGDLFESLIKRESGIKDAGSLFGPHGGALDRLDGIIFTVVAGYYIWYSVVH